MMPENSNGKRKGFVRYLICSIICPRPSPAEIEFEKAADAVVLETKELKREAGELIGAIHKMNEVDGIILKAFDRRAEQ
jgi:hypothetical protein